MAKQKKAARNSLPKERRQAVLVIHGMGQQRPMETLRSVVRALWDKDLSLTDKRAEIDRDAVRKLEPIDGIGPPQEINKSWIVPDTRTGSKELGRITTPASDAGVRTDFYEFYWADIMEGTTFDHLKSWVRDLLLRWPHQVPKDVVAAWYVLWFLTLLVAVTALLGTVSVFGGDELAGSGIALTMKSIAERVFSTWGAVFVVAGLLVGVVMNLRLAKRYEGRVTLHDRAFALVVPLIFGILLAIFFPVSLLSTGGFWLLAGSFVVGVFIRSFLVPYFGDVARYVRSDPDTIAKRAAVMERGLSLLRRLHGDLPSSSSAVSKRDLSDAVMNYDRVIVVAHSLGSVIAYDLLRNFWTERGPTGQGVLNKEGEAALVAMDAYLKSVNSGDVPFDLAEYRILQRDVSAALAKAKDDGTWLISDFVTLGSPLTHAEFLLARDQAAFENGKSLGLLPCSPPHADEPDASILYESVRHGGVRARHTALFAATRWTNIHDRHRKILLGDIISGPLEDNFGKGIVDFNIRILKGGLASQVFTHNHYWSMKARGKLISWNFTFPNAVPEDDQDHIRLLRKAVDLNDL